MVKKKRLLPFTQTKRIQYFILFSATISMMLMTNEIGGQTLTANFEVASVRPSGPKSGRLESGGPGTSDPLLYRYSSATLEDLIGTAWNVDYQFIISRIPLDRHSFDIIARVPPGATREQFRTMLQNLLKTRFHLETHSDSRKISGWALVIAKSGLRVDHANADGSTQLVGVPASPDLPPIPQVPSNRPIALTQYFRRNNSTFVRIVAQNESIATIIRSIPKPDGQPIVDQTGLKGSYSFVLEYAQDNDLSGAGGPNGDPSIFPALKEQLGLELVKRKDLPFNFIVVDKVDQEPSDN
jgi:uncharacterized protein (TIGR03435 family)